MMTDPGRVPSLYLCVHPLTCLFGNTRALGLCMDGYHGIQINSNYVDLLSIDAISDRGRRGAIYLLVFDCLLLLPLLIWWRF